MAPKSTTKQQTKNKQKQKQKSLTSKQLQTVSKQLGSLALRNPLGRLQQAGKTGNQVSDYSWPVTNVNRGYKSSLETSAKSSYIKSALYAASLLRPEYAHDTRIPDIDAARTAVYKSVRTFQIPYADPTATNNPGVFCAVVQPKLGNYGSVTSANILMVDPTVLAANPLNLIDFSSPTTYVSKQEMSNPFVVDDFDILTQPPLAQVDLTSNGTRTATLLYGDAAPTYATQSTLSLPYYTTGTNVGRFEAPEGVFQLSAVIIGTGLTGPFVVDGLVPVSTPSNIVTATTAMLSGFYTAPTGSFEISLTAATTVTFSRLMLSPSDAQNLPASVNAGLVKLVRPVCLSALVTSTGPELVTGGEIAGCYVNGGELNNLFSAFAPTSDLGSLLGYAALSKYPGNYNGPVKEGIYIWWAPENPLNNMFYTPSEANAYSYPFFIIVGRVSDNAVRLRLRVDMLMEYKTGSRVPGQELCPGNTQLYEFAVSNITTLPHAMANHDHNDWLATVGQTLGKAYGWMKDELVNVDSMSKTLTGQGIAQNISTLVGLVGMFL